MKKTVLYILFVPLVLFVLVNPVEAHFLSTDGNIGAVLHVDPNDDPIAGSQASFFFDFKDKENKFTPQKCNCTFAITENGNEIFSQSLFQSNSNPSLSSASVFYTFPKRDVYQVKVTGQPTLPNAFQPFTLTWNFRVDQEATLQTGSGQNNSTNFFATHMIHIIILAIIVIGFLAYIITHRHKRKNESNPPSFKTSARQVRPSFKLLRGEEGGEKNNDKKDIGNKY